MPRVVLLFSVFPLLCHGVLAAAQDTSTGGGGGRFVGSLGAILDLSSHAGRRHKLAMELAVEDYQDSTGNMLSLHLGEARANPTQAASEARRLIKDKRVQSILGSETWVETAVVADAGDEAQVPVLSFTDGSPSWASERWPFLLQSIRSRTTEGRAVSAIIRSWQWRRVTVIYEDGDYTASSFISNLVESIRELGSDVDYQVAISPFTSIPMELQRLNSRQCRIFVVHTTPSLAARLFAETLKMGMMERDYVWITTAMINDCLDSLDPSVISSMEGVLGVKSYFPQSAAITDFSTRMRRSFRLGHPEEVSPHVGVLDLHAYDTVWTVAKAMEKFEPKGNYSSYFQTNGKSSGDAERPIVFSKGHQLLRSILGTNFSGLSGRVQFSRGVMVPRETFQIVNVVGKSYREMGYWTNDLGFSKGISPGSYYSASMVTLGQVIWPGGSSVSPRGWAPSTGEKPLRIGVPALSAFPDYVSAKYEISKNQTRISGFSIDIFRAALEYLPYSLAYELVAYYGSYDSLFERVPMKVFDAVVGDTAILSYRCELVQFSQPYTQSGYVMVVPLQPEGSNKAWIFTKPFKSSLWISIGALCLMNSLVVWLIERGSNDEDQGSPSTELGVSICLSLATLFNNGERVHSNLSRLVMVVWLFVGLVLTSNYTASLSSMLTVQRLEPSVTDVELLKRTDAVMGCNKGGSIVRFLNEFLGFPMSNIKQFSNAEEYVEAFRNGEIKAAIFAVGHAKMFLAEYCKEFTTAGPTYHAGGFGFAFPKGSPLLPDVSEAILKVFESGKMQAMENAVLSSYNCSSSLTSETDKLGPESFWGLFAVMGMTSGIALLIFLCSKADSLWRGASAALSACARRLSKVLRGSHGAAAALWGRVREMSLPVAGTTVSVHRTDLEMVPSGLPMERRDPVGPP